MLTKKTAASTNNRGYDVNERYQQKTDLEHVLLRSDTYVGGLDMFETETWVVETKAIKEETDQSKLEKTTVTEGKETTGETKEVLPKFTTKIVKRKIRYSPALLKIFDEILINARDHTVRDKTCNKIRVTIDETTGVICVENNGEGIPVEQHEKGCFLPELIFGHFKTGENFSDEEKKVVGGKNGFGSKVSNAFSLKFEIETIDSHTKKRYVQVWENNMSVMHKPTITSCSKAPYTKVTFLPDYKRLGGAAHIEADFVALAKRRVYDLAACTAQEVLVYLNGEKLPFRTFEKYINLYLGENKTDVPRVFMTIPNEDVGSVAIIPHWEIAVALSDDGFKHTSFVNGISTSEGGTHVNYIRDQLTRKLGKLIRDKNPSASLKPEYIRENLWIFINAHSRQSRVFIANEGITHIKARKFWISACHFGRICGNARKAIKSVETRCGIC